MPAAISARQTDAEVLQALGARLKQYRLTALAPSASSQQALAKRAGVGLSTIKAAEAGRPVSLANFAAILRALGLIEQLGLLVPQPEPSPMAVLEGAKPERQRASAPRLRRKNAAAFRRKES